MAIRPVSAPSIQASASPVVPSALESASLRGEMLRRGASGPAVKELQEKLNALGFDCGKADGVFGAKTAAAVTAYQKAQGSAVLGKADGVVGPRTFAALLGGTPPASSTATSTQAPADSFESSQPKLRRMTNSEVTPAITAKAKEILKQYGKAQNYGMEIPFEIDGKKYAARIEQHYHPPGGPVKPWGPHPGVSMFVVE